MNYEKKIIAKLKSNITIIFNKLLKIKKENFTKYSINKSILVQLDIIFLKKNINNINNNNSENNNLLILIMIEIKIIYLL